MTGSATAWQLYDMIADAGEKNDIAKDKPEIVKDLAARYDAWFADISSEGLQRFPIPVGHPEENPVEIHAPQAYYSGAMQFASGQALRTIGSRVGTGMSRASCGLNSMS